MGIAFFDLDKTLLAQNSGRLWLAQELRRGRVSYMQALRASFWIARYQLGFSGLDEAIARAIGMLAGKKERDVREQMLAFYTATVRTLYRPGALKVLSEHRQRGDRLVLLSSTSSYLAEPVAEELGLDAALCNRFEVDPDGVHTGRCVGTLCFGEGKRVHAHDYAQQLGVELDACAFYTDSYLDLPLLEVVGRPVAVNPDHRLRRFARRRGWEVADWGTPSPQLAMAG